ncbi:MAG: PP2C family protein-serine/threonine phosphatase [Jatrophihabitans sp.]|uniref:PP2C family protein-serine/threonine phosphatase n=1 Tax=Jatrophihabitans sp. TaxID=1932789 RepID=UPI003F7CDDC5
MYELTDLRVGSMTDVGCVRELNEDAVLVRGPLFAVADGMGGHAAGEVAAAIALEHLSVLADRPVVDRTEVVAAIDRANAAILRAGAADPAAAGLGTTVSGVCFASIAGSPHWLIFNVGDSRVYRHAGGRLSQVTVDHSEVEELVAAGHITREQARTHPMRNVVTRSLGTDPAPVCDIWVLPVEAGDRFLICSDGLSGEVDDAAIEAALRDEPDPQRAAVALVHQALDAGAHDNVSVIVVGLPLGDDQQVDITAPRKQLRGTA